MNVDYLFPLSYSIPMKNIQDIKELKKKKIFSKMIPGDKKTYIYKDEISYNKNYQESYFSFTYKKGGFDTLRHYEILANNSIPYFIDIEKIPNKTMTTYPKSIIIDAINCYKNNPNDIQLIDHYITKLNSYTINYLTCEKSAENFLNKINIINKKSNPKIKILMISGPNMNYSMMCLAYGLRKNLKHNFVDYPKLKNLYSKRQFNLHIEDDIKIDRNYIENKIKKKFFDYIIFGSIGPDEPKFIKNLKINNFPSNIKLSSKNNLNKLLIKNKILNKNNFESLVQSYYKKTEIIYIFGGDRPFNITCSNIFKDYLYKYLKKGICFVRELDDNTKYFHNGSWEDYKKERANEFKKKIEITKLILHLNIS